MNHLLKTLNKALSLKRPHGSNTVRFFTSYLASQIPEEIPSFFDNCGNLHVDNRHDTSNRTLFVAHVDTVHHKEGPNSIRKTKEKWYANGDALGADDGAGCALLIHMISNNIPAYYIFTQGEEVGGIGAKFLRKHSMELLSQFDRAIAFDRKATDSIITHQWAGRCCSDEFASTLSDVLNSSERFMYSPDDTGVYTDTAEFADIIPECTNISVGYNNEHSDKECLDIIHFEDLARAIITTDWDALPTLRDPNEIEEDIYGYGTYPYPLNEEDCDFLEMDTIDALSDALYGNYRPISDLIAEAIYPEDPITVLKFINTRKMTPKLINEMLNLLDVDTPDSVLNIMFDRVYKE